MTTVAGGGSSTGDNGLATAALLSDATLVVDSAGNLFVGDYSRVRKVSNGIITTVAGNGSAGFGGDDGPAVKAQLNGVVSLAVDAADNLYIGPTQPAHPQSLEWCNHHRCRERTQGFSGDGGAAISAQLYYPLGLVVDSSGNLFIADQGNSRIRKVSNRVLLPLPGTGTQGFSGDGGPALDAQVTNPDGVAVDSAGNLYFVANSRVRKVSNGVITTVAGNGADAAWGSRLRHQAVSGCWGSDCAGGGDEQYVTVRRSAT